jgi:carboxylesterase
MIHNPHLEGKSFYWSGNHIGILLSHGFTATTAEVRLLAQILHRVGYTISAPLLPGHFTTPEDLNSVKWQDWLKTIERSYQNLRSDCNLIFVGGESTGGLLALYLASIHAEITGILTYSPALRLARTKFELTCLNLLAPFIPYIRKTKKDEELPWQGYTLYPLRAARELTKLQQIISDRLAIIHQPILIVQGKYDTTVHPEAPQMIYQNISSSIKEIHMMENSTHVVLVDKEIIEVGAITQKFISRVLQTHQD